MYTLPWGFPGGSAIKNLPAMQEMWVQSPGWEDPFRGRKRQTTAVFLSREFHGQRSLAGYSPWGRKGLDTTERPSTPSHTELHALNW